MLNSFNGRAYKSIKNFYRRGLAPLFLAFWAGSLFFMAQVLDSLLAAPDPAASLLGLILGLWTVYLAQALFYLPRRPAGPPVFLRPRLFAGPLVFLPAPPSLSLEIGPAFFAVAAPGDRIRLRQAAEARLAAGFASRLSRLLEDGSPLEAGLRYLAARPWRPLAWPAWLLVLLLSPPRQILRLWGYFFFLAWRAWDDPGPADELTVYKRRLAADLVRRYQAEFRPGAEDENERLVRLRELLAHIYQDPGYGSELGEPWPEAPAPPAEAPPPWLAPRYRGVFLDLPAAAGAGEEFHDRPETDLGLFYPPELTRETEAAALLAAERYLLAGLLADQAGAALVRLDGRPVLSWRLLARLDDLEDRRERILRRVLRHHARCRSAHLAAAARLGSGWPEALRALGGWLSLAEDGRRALSLAQASLREKMAGRRPAAELKAEADNFYAVWADLKRRLMEMDPPWATRPADFAERFSLAPPTAADWRNWRWEPAADFLDRALAGLRDWALTELLAAEDRVAAGGAGLPPSVPAAPPLRLAAEAVARPKPLRVYSPAVWLKAAPGRSAAAALLTALLLWQSDRQGLSQVVIYNGLEEAATVTAAGRPLDIPPFSRRDLRLRPGREYEFSVRVRGWPVENFRQRLAPRPATEVYNVAGAAPLMEWRFPSKDGVFLGRPRWLLARADFIFEEPPGDGEALVLSGYGDGDSPEEMMAAFPEGPERDELARLHALWTPLTDPRFAAWLAQVKEEDRPALLWERLARDFLPFGGTPFGGTPFGGAPEARLTWGRQPD